MLNKLTFDKVSPYLKVTNLAVNILGVVPTLTTQIISIVGQQAVKVGKEVEGRYKYVKRISPNYNLP